MLTIDDVLKKASEKLLDLSPTPNLDAELILCHVLSCDRINLISNKYSKISEEDEKKFSELITRRINGEPVQYIVGFQEFMGLPFKVESGVLIPRPDTEVLVETVLNNVNMENELKILELGTGSGAIPISLAHYMKNARFWTVDISMTAFRIAKENAKLNKVNNRIEFLLGDLFEPVKNMGEFDLIISNPPYIPSDEIEELQIEVAKYEPKIALDGGADGLDFYRKIANESVKYLSQNGIIIFEIGYNQGEDVRSLLDAMNFVQIDVIKDLAGKDRVVIGRRASA